MSLLRFGPLLWANLWRNRRRSILTVLGVAVAIFVYAALGSAIDAMTFPVRQAGADQTLNVREAARSNVLASRLPQSAEDRVAAIPGVRAATGVLSDLAVIGDEQVHVFVRGVDPQRFRDVQQLELADGAWEAFREDSSAALVGHRLLAKMDWEVGREAEVSEMGLRFRVVGVIPAQGVDLENHLLLRRRHLQALRSAENQISYVLAIPADTQDTAELGARIDEAFALSPTPTETTTAAAYAESIVRDFMGFIDYLRIMGLIAVLVTMLGAANAIAMSVRERTREIGLLKAIGFPPRLILGLILFESVVLSVIGGAIGLALATIVVNSQGAAMAGMDMTAEAAAIAAVLALIIGLLGGAVPAVAAARLKTVDALRVIG